MERDVLIDLQTFDRYTAIAHIRLTERMTEGEELIPGGACAAVLEAELYGDTPIPRGRELKYFHDSVSLGIFRVEESRVLSAGRYKITCYDLMTLFDRDVTEAWNSKLPGWASTALTNLCKTLGKEPAPEPEKPKLAVDYVAECEKNLSSHLGRGVKIINGKRKGRFELEFYGQDDLQNLLDALMTLKK